MTSPERSIRWTAILALAMAGMLLVVGCGGGGDDDTTSSAGSADEPLTKDEYISQADEICAQNSLTVGQAARDQFGSAQPNRDQTLQFAQDVVIPSTEQTLERLRSLPAPTGDEKELTATYDALEKGIDELKDNPSQFLEPNVGGAFDEANRLAQAYGFEQCGQG